LESDLTLGSASSDDTVLLSPTGRTSMDTALEDATRGFDSAPSPPATSIALGQAASVDRSRTPGGCHYISANARTTYGVKIKKRSHTALSTDSLFIYQSFLLIFDAYRSIIHTVAAFIQNRQRPISKDLEWSISSLPSPFASDMDAIFSCLLFSSLLSVSIYTEVHNDILSSILNIQMYFSFYYLSR